MDATSPHPHTPSDDGDAAFPGSARTRRLLSWPVLVALFLLPGVLWALASPLFSVPDEPSHTVKAVAVWHGQLSGQDEVGPSDYLTTTFQLPAIWAQASPNRECFAFHPEVSADCAPPFAGSASTSGVTTTAGHYPPLFYALVGWGGLASAGPVGLYVMRITSALACAALLAASVRALARIVDPRLALAGVLVATTPMVLFLAGSVNPNGLEIAAAIAVWSTLLAVLHWGDRRGGPPPRGLLVQLAIAGSVMALTRTLSPAFLAAIALLAALSVPVPSVRRVLRDRATLIAGGVVVGVAALATVAIVASGALSSTPGRIGVGAHNPALVIFGETDGYVAEMIGVFGWLDTRAPAFTLFAWLAAVFGVAALGLVLGSRRSALTLLAVLAATVVVPIVVQYPSATAQGLPWQGRYTLPIAVGLPLVAMVAIDRERAVERVARRLAVGLAALTGAATVAAFTWALRRYVSGSTGSLRIWSGEWQPPGGAVLLVVGMVVFAAGALTITALVAPRTAGSPTNRSGASRHDPNPTALDV